MNNIFSDHPTWTIGIVIALFGIIAAHRLLIYRDKKNIFNAAARDFTKTIHDELREIYPVPANWPKDINVFLREKFPALQSAVNTFAKYLPKREQERFFQDWSLYRLGKNGREIDNQYYWQYIPHTSTSVVDGKETTFDNTNTYKEDFKRNVKNLLKYAKQT